VASNAERWNAVLPGKDGKSLVM